MSEAIVVDIDGCLSQNLANLIGLLPEEHDIIVLTYRRWSKPGNIQQFINLLPRKPAQVIMRIDGTKLNPAEFKVQHLHGLRASGIEPVAFFDNDPYIVRRAAQAGYPAVCVVAV